MNAVYFQCDWFFDHNFRAEKVLIIKIIIQINGTHNLKSMRMHLKSNMNRIIPLIYIIINK